MEMTEIGANTRYEYYLSDFVSNVKNYGVRAAIKEDLTQTGKHLEKTVIDSALGIVAGIGLMIAMPIIAYRVYQDCKSPRNK